ncbi:MAG TPA: ankyrin repeat domain-containing protein [Blastocatellia bacterium]|nr:ankyrin repeat domain-containing protein [Blastocatellia bacterium]
MKTGRVTTLFLAIILTPSVGAATVPRQNPAPSQSKGCLAKGETPAEGLLAAAARGDMAAVKNMLDNRANVNLQDGGGRTALFFAADRGRTEIVKMLLARGADAKTAAGAKALSAAACAGDLESVKAILGKGADINAQDKEGVTALMVAAEENRVEVVKLLLTRGANASLKDEDGETALDYAEFEEHKEVIEILKRAKKK